MKAEDLKRLNLIEYARTRWRIDVNDKGSAHCPFHPPDNNPSFSIFENRDGSWLWKDFHDDETGSIIDLKARLEGKTPGEGIRELLDEFYPRASKVNAGVRQVLRSHIYRNEHGEPIHKKVKYSDGQYGWFHWTGSNWAMGKGTHAFIPFNLERLGLAKLAIVCEGEKDAETIIPFDPDSEVIWATSAPNGKGSWPDTITPYFKRFNDIIFIYDVGNEDDARKHARKLHEAFPGMRISLAKIPIERKEADITDYLNQVEDKLEEFVNLVQYPEVLYMDGRALKPQNGSHPQPILVNLATVNPRAVEWLWKDRIPLGKLSFIAGDPGQGKSYLTLFIAKHVTLGLPLPASSDINTMGSVIMLSAEDGLADTIRVRAEKMRADLAKINVLEGVTTEKRGKKIFNISKDLPMLENAIDQLIDVRAIIIDPISAYLGSVNAMHNTEVRSVLAPLADLADKHGIAVIGITHLNKKQDLKTIYRALDSMAFVAAARSVLLVASDPNDPERGRRLLVPIKGNLSANQKSLAFRIDDYGPQFEPDELSLDPDTLDTIGKKEPSSLLEEATDWLRELLQNGQVSSLAVQKLARESGFSERTIRRAKKNLGVESFLKEDGQVMQWFWILPSLKTPGAKDLTIE